jgi:hypothetical protein
MKNNAHQIMWAVAEKQKEVTRNALQNGELSIHRAWLWLADFR